VDSYFYEGETEHEFACPGCSEVFLELGKDGEIEVKAESKGKIIYKDEEDDISLFCLSSLQRK
jgi:hypothetical protein